MRETKENPRGITLMVLVITIVVLLILASVTITGLIGDKGIINEARDAKKQTEIKSLEEQIDISIIQAEEKHKKTTLDNVIEELIKNKVITDGSQVNRETGSIQTSLGYVIEGKLNEYIGIPEEPIKDIVVNLSIEKAGEKEISIVSNLENVIGRNYKYTIYVNNEEKETGNSNKDTIRYNYATTFGTSEIYVKVEYEKNSIQSEVITIEDTKIGNKSELEKFRENVNKGISYAEKTVELIKDIDLEENEANQWIPIGNSTANKFIGGTFDGKGHTINNIYVSTDKTRIALFGYLEGSTIKNVTVKGKMILSSTDKNFSAGIVSTMNNSTISNCASYINIEQTNGERACIRGNNRSCN